MGKRILIVDDEKDILDLLEAKPEIEKLNDGDKRNQWRNDSVKTDNVKKEEF